MKTHKLICIVELFCVGRLCSHFRASVNYMCILNEQPGARTDDDVDDELVP